MCHAFSHIMNIYHFKAQNYEYSDNQEYTPTQSGRKKKIKSCPSWRLKIHKGQNSNRPLDKDIDKVTIKILHSLNVQLKMRHKTSEYTKYNASKRIHYIILLKY